MSLSQIKSVITFRQDSEPPVKVPGDVWLNPRTEVVQTWNGVNWDLNWKGYGLYGYSVGGYESVTPLSTIERFNFPFNAGVSNKVANVSDNVLSSSGCNSSNYGYVGNSSTNTLKLYRFEFPFDSGTAGQIGNVLQDGEQSSSCNSSDQGFFMGGSVGAYNYHSFIQRITFPFSSGTSTTVGNLSSSNRASSACNSSLEGYVIGGTNSPTSDYLGISTIDKIVFPFNSGVAAAVGVTTQARSKSAGFNSSKHGYTAAGWRKIGIGINYFSFIERITFPWNTGVATFTGYASFEGYKTAGCNSSTYAYMMGGYNGSISLSTVDRIQFPFRSGYSTSVGSLTGLRYENVGLDECDFVNQFV